MRHTLAALCAITLLAHSMPANAQGEPKKDTAQKEQQLKEVSVQAQKNAIETAPGKTIVNVQAMAGNAGKNILDVLRKLPGVSVDGQGNISMAGKQGVLITVDGRETFLSGDELLNYLKGMAVEEVSQIELVAQPSAHYDAEGNAGIINLKMRKIKKQGFNGNASIAYTYSKLYGSNNTLLLNYRRNKVNTYASINYLNAGSTVDWRNYFKFQDAAGNTVATSTMHSVPVEAFEKWNLRTGADYNYSAATTIGLGLTGAYYGNTMHSLINTINDGLNSNPMLMSRYTTEASLRRNAGVNLYMKHTFSKQSELNVNLDYLLFTRIMAQNLTTYAVAGGAPIPGQLVLRSQIPINIQVGSAKADYSYTLANGMKWETGGKLSNVGVDNTGRYDTYAGGNWAHDNSRSNHFLYQEKIVALYINTVKKLDTGGKWEAQLGLRAEVAQLHGLQEATGEQFSREIPALFPTAYLSYKPNANNSLEANYGRRVERPHYNMLNPFNYYTFYNSYQRGNPALLPQYSHNAELKHTYKNTLTTSLGLSTVSDNLSNVVLADNATQTTYGMPVNFGTTKMASLTMSYTGQATKWWGLMAAAQLGYGAYTGKVGSQQVSNSGAFEALWVNSQFNLGKWVAECYLNYNTSAVSSPVEKARANLYTNFAVSHKWLRDTLNVKLAVDDPFYVYKTVAEYAQPGLYSQTSLQPNSRTATLSFAYSFGKAQENSRRNSSMPDEAGRL